MKRYYPFIALMILEFLYLETNKTHPADMETILQHIVNRCDVNIDRRTFRRNIKGLQDVMGYKQVKVRRTKDYTRKCLYWWED